MKFGALEKSIWVLEKSLKSPWNFFPKKGTNTVQYLSTLISIYDVKNDADEDANLKGDSPSTCSTETDSGVSEGCSDNGTSTEEDEVDNSSKGGSQVDGATASKEVELTEDMCNGDLAQDMKVRWTVVLNAPPPSSVTFLCAANCIA